MPWRMIAFVVLLVIIMFFIGYNLDNRSDISLVFVTIEQVPVFFTIFGSFVFGVLIMLPMAIRGPLKKKKNEKALLSEQGKFNVNADGPIGDDEKYAAESKKTKKQDGK